MGANAGIRTYGLKQKTKAIRNSNTNLAHNILEDHSRFIQIQTRGLNESILHKGGEKAGFFVLFEKC